jgi:phage terminase large subunit
MPDIEIPNGWTPRPYQLPAWSALEAGCKRAALVWHRRAGKDSMSVNWTAASAFDRVGTYWHMAPTHRQVRKIVWDGIDRSGRRIIDQAFPPAVRARKNDQEMKIEVVNGSIWQCVGSDNFDSLVGANPVGVVFSEWSLADPRAWDFVRPILAENGGWALFIYTPRGRNHGARLLDMARAEDGWFSQVLTVEDTGAVPMDVIDQERRELVRQYGEDDADKLIRQEWYCSFDAAIRGSYYADWMDKADREGRIGKVEHDPAHKVHTAWDLGIGDSTAIWMFQVIGRDVRVIDYLEASGQGLSWYVDRLNERPYQWGQHWLPHDANVSELGTGKRRIDLLNELGVMGWVLPRTSVDDGIQAARALLPRCWFDHDKCERGIDALRSYRRDWDEKLQNYRDRPLHDWSSHAADAFRYLALGQQEAPRPAEDAEPAKPFTDDWFAARERRDAHDEATRANYYR